MADTSTNILMELSPFNFIFDNSKQNYSTCDIAGYFYIIHDLKSDDKIQNKKDSTKVPPVSNYTPK
jgi:hypothetical protein